MRIKRKISHQRVGLVICIAMLIALALPAVASADGLPPCRYVGPATINGAYVEANTPITAWIGGTQVSDPVLTGDGEGLEDYEYCLIVELASAPEPNEVALKIGDLWANEIYPWIGYGRVTAHLTVTTEAPALKINEFVSDPGVVQVDEWIELYNPEVYEVNLDGWTIEDGTHSPALLTGKTIAAEDYLVLVKGIDFTFDLNNAGDTIILKMGDTEVDKVTYGNWDDGNTADNAPAPGEDESTGRCPNCHDTNVDNLDFKVFPSSVLGPTPGEPNNACPGDADHDGDVDVFDWVKVQRILEGLDSPTCGADTDHDGDVDVFDWVKVRRMLEGIDPHPC